jgi:hypothetical protein
LGTLTSPVSIPLEKEITTQTNSGEDVGEKEILIYCWWECKLVQPLWKTLWRLLKKLNIDLPYDPATPLVGAGNQKTERQVSAPYPPWEHCELYILRKRHLVSQICHKVDKQDALKIVSSQ